GGPRTVSAPRPEASWLQGLEPRANAEGSTSEVPVVSHQRVQQLLRVLQVGGVEPLGEPPVDRCEHLSRLVLLALLPQPPRQAGGRAYLMRLCLLATSDRERFAEARFGFAGRPRATQQQFT